MMKGPAPSVWVAVVLVSASLASVWGSGAPAAGETAAALAGADAERGRALFVAKGCVACHSINEIGGTSAPPLDANPTSGEIDPLDFVARMWRGAEAMIFMQQRALGEQLDFTGRELADIIAFAHDPDAQRRFSADDVPPEVRRLIQDQ